MRQGGGVFLATVPRRRKKRDGLRIKVGRDVVNDPVLRISGLPWEDRYGPMPATPMELRAVVRAAAQSSAEIHHWDPERRFCDLEVVILQRDVDIADDTKVALRLDPAGGTLYLELG